MCKFLSEGSVSGATDNYEKNNELLITMTKWNSRDVSYPDWPAYTTYEVFS